MWQGPGVFSLGLPKCFLLHMGFIQLLLLLFCFLVSSNCISVFLFCFFFFLYFFFYFFFFFPCFLLYFLVFFFFFNSSFFGLCYLTKKKKKKLKCPYTIFLIKKMCYFFVLFNGDIIVNIYQLHFPTYHFSSQSNK